MTRQNKPTCRHLMVLLQAAFMFLSVQSIQAQQWQLRPEVSFTTFSAGWPLADTIATGYHLLQARNGAYLQLGYGLSLQRDYYLLIPERESALQFFGGYEQLGFAGTDDETRELRRVYLRFGLDQILAGDRNRDNRYLMLSLFNTSRWVLPQPEADERSAPGGFFTHTPRLQLAFKLAGEPDFWRVLGLSGSISAGLESGHARDADPWAFLVGRAEVGCSLPLFRHWLYLEASGRAQAYLVNLRPEAEYPVWYYTDYRIPAWAAGQVDLKSRILKTNPMVPIGLELGAGIGGRLQGESLMGLDVHTIEPVIRFFVDLAVDSSPIFAFRLRGGVTWHLPSGEIGLLFTTL